MGNDASTEVKGDGKHKREGGLSRSSSLRVNRTPAQQNFALRKDFDGPTISSVTSNLPKLKRSNTFSSSGSFSRPNIHSNKTTTDLTTSIIEENKRSEMNKLNSDRLNEMSIADDIVEGEIKHEEYILRQDVGYKTNLTSTESRQEGTTSQVVTTTASSSPFPSVITHESNETTTKKYEEKITPPIDRHRANSLDFTLPYKSRENKTSSDCSQVASDMTIKQNVDSKMLFNKEESVRKLSTSERRKKNVIRSQSMNTHGTRPKVTVHRSNSAEKDDMLLIKQNSSAPTSNDGRSRRISDSCLLKEQHIKRSEQFTQMLKQYQRPEQRNKKLSSYGLGVITETAREETDGKKFKFQHRREYFDSWLKDQSDRINELSQAVKGDSENINRLRASFRERALRSPQKDLLPRRPNSVKLPRRKNNMYAQNIASSPESENDDSFLESLRLRKQELDQNGNEIRPKDPLKKQLSDTLLLVDKSFKPKYEPMPRKDGIRFSKPTSTSYNNGANNVAVVKPMCFQNDELDSVKETTLIANYVTSVQYHTLPESLICNNSTLLYITDKQSILEEEKSLASHIKQPVNDKYICSDLINKESDDCALRNTECNSVNTLNEKPCTNVNRDKNTKNDNHEIHKHENNSPNICAETDNKSHNSFCSVNRITDSLSKVMSDLKELRKQDVRLARQLIGLGKSIKEFKHQQSSSEDDTEPE